jgi:hypothetical protein
MDPITVGSRWSVVRRPRALWVDCHERTEPSDCPDSNEPRDWYDPAETIDIADAHDPREPNDATEPIERTEPAEPMESTESVDAMDRIDRRDRMDHVERTVPSCLATPTRCTRYPDAVELPSLRAVIGGVLGLGIAAGFEFEHAWLFLTTCVLFLAWCGYMLFAPDES